jgi:hypothetical protein
MVGIPASGPYLADTGFEGRERHRRWAEAFGAQVLVPPRNDRRHAWPVEWRRWHAGLRQIVEVVHAKWTEQFRLDEERPHTLIGLPTMLSKRLPTVYSDGKSLLRKITASMSTRLKGGETQATSSSVNQERCEARSIPLQPARGGSL